MAGSRGLGPAKQEYKVDEFLVFELNNELIGLGFIDNMGADQNISGHQVLPEFVAGFTQQQVGHCRRDEWVELSTILHEEATQNEIVAISIVCFHLHREYNLLFLKFKNANRLKLYCIYTCNENVKNWQLLKLLNYY